MQFKLYTVINIVSVPSCYLSTPSSFFINDNSQTTRFASEAFHVVRNISFAWPPLTQL